MLCVAPVPSSGCFSVLFGRLGFLRICGFSYNGPLVPLEGKCCAQRAGGGVCVGVRVLLTVYVTSFYVIYKCIPSFCFPQYTQHEPMLPSPPFFSPPLAPVRLHAPIEGVRADRRGAGGVGAGGGRGAPQAPPSSRSKTERGCDLCGLDLRIGLENILDFYWACYFNTPRVVG